MDRMLGDRLRVIRLFDAYGSLLTLRQRALLRLYYHRDLSLGEIAVQHKISRQAVFDSLHRSIEELEHLEAALQFVERQKRAMLRRQAAAGRMNALEDTIQGLTGRLDQKTVKRLLNAVTALRETVS